MAEEREDIGAVNPTRTASGDVSNRRQRPRRLGGKDRADAGRSGTAKAVDGAGNMDASGGVSGVDAAVSDVRSLAPERIGVLGGVHVGPRTNSDDVSAELPGGAPGRMRRADRPALGKDEGIETLRGFAILLVVIGHVIGADPGQGMEVADDSWWRYAYYSFADLRMPLFTVISGYVYALRPVTPQTSLLAFMLGKLRRIGLPLVCVSSVHYLAKEFLGGNQMPMWQIYLFGYDHFWFLHAILVIFAMVAVLDWTNQIGRPWQLGVFFAIALAYAMHRPLAPVLFGIRPAMRLLPYFVLGCMLVRLPALRSTRFVVSVAILFCIAMLARQWNWFAGTASLDWYDKTREDWAVATLIGLSGPVLLFAVRRPIRVLASIGHQAYAIYLFHVFGTAAVLAVMSTFTTAGPVTTFLVSVAVGVAFPIGLTHVLSRVPVVRTMFLGLSSRPRRTAAAGEGLSRGMAVKSAV